MDMLAGRRDNNKPPAADIREIYGLHVKHGDVATVSLISN
jgi:hypothetical protein